MLLGFAFGFDALGFKDKSLQSFAFLHAVWV